MKQPIIFINKVHPPKHTLFDEQIKVLISNIDHLTGRRNKPSDTTQAKRLLASTLIIQGLYRCFCSQSKEVSLGVPCRPIAYNANDENRINNISFKSYNILIRMNQFIYLRSIN